MTTSITLFIRYYYQKLSALNNCVGNLTKIVRIFKKCVDIIIMRCVHACKEVCLDPHTHALISLSLKLAPKIKIAI